MGRPVHCSSLTESIPSGIDGVGTHASSRKLEAELGEEHLLEALAEGRTHLLGDGRRVHRERLRRRRSLQQHAERSRMNAELGGVRAQLRKGRLDRVVARPVHLLALADDRGDDVGVANGNSEVEQPSQHRRHRSRGQRVARA